MLLASRWVSIRKYVKWSSINKSTLTVVTKLSISRKTTFSPIYVLQRRQPVFLSLHVDMIFNELNSHMPLQQGIRFICLLNRLVVYSLPTAMSYSTVNHTMDLFYLLKEGFKNLLFDLLITGRSFEDLSYLSSCSQSQRGRIQRIRSNVIPVIESDIAYTEVSGAASQYILRSRSIWQQPA